jgi:hypothetical protein
VAICPSVDYTELLTTARKWFLSFFVEELGFYELVYFYDLHRFFMAGVC